MGEDAEPLYDAALMRLMSEAYETAAERLGESDKAAEVAMAVAIINAINDGERGREKLVERAVAAGRNERSSEEPRPDAPKKRGVGETDALDSRAK